MQLLNMDLAQGDDGRRGRQPKRSADPSEAYLVEVAPNLFLSNTFLELWPVKFSR